MNEAIQICARCVMDTTDPLIRFDDAGVCNYCRTYEAGKFYQYSEAEGVARLERIARKIRMKGRGRDYDCILGLSGGIDSSYAAFRAAELGLRPLAVHFDSGWNSEASAHNIESIVNKLGIDLFTVVCDWEEMRGLQRSFFLASVVNCDIPQDHAFIAVLYQVAAEHGIRTWISGHNTSTESIMSPAWRGYTSQDWTFIRSLHERMGGTPLRRYPHYTFYDRHLRYPLLKGIRTVNILDYLPYDKREAKAFLGRQIEWRDYGGKHCESVFTRFFQGYYLPEKFGFDKRKAHLASLIVSGQLSRDEALAELANPPYALDELRNDKAFVLKKLGFSDEEWDAIMKRPMRNESEFETDQRLYSLLALRAIPGRVKRKLLPNWRR